MPEDVHAQQSESSPSPGADPAGGPSAVPASDSKIDGENLLASLAKEGLIEQNVVPAPAVPQPVAQPPEAEASVDDGEPDPSEKAVREEIENLGKILEESLTLQRAIVVEKQKQDELAQQENYRQRYRQMQPVCYLRWGIAAIGMLGFFIGGRHIMILGVVACVAMFNLLNIYYIEGRKPPVISFPVSMVFDSIMILGLVHWSGEAHSPLFLLYYALLGLVAWIYPLPVSLICAGGVLAGYALYVLGGESHEAGRLFWQCIGFPVVVGWMVALRYVFERVWPSVLPVWTAVRGALHAAPAPAAAAAGEAGGETMEALRARLQEEQQKSRQYQDELEKMKQRKPS